MKLNYRPESIKIASPFFVVRLSQILNFLFLTKKGLLTRPFCQKYLGHVLRTFALIVSAHPYCARKSTCHVMPRLVQSLNSPFFPPHIGAEPGPAKEKSRITCMRMLRTNQSKITTSQPRRWRQCVAQCFFQLAL